MSKNKAFDFLLINFAFSIIYPEIIQALGSEIMKNCKFSHFWDNMSWKACKFFIYFYTILVKNDSKVSEINSSLGSFEKESTKEDVDRELKLDKMAVSYSSWTINARIVWISNRTYSLSILKYEIKLYI